MTARLPGAALGVAIAAILAAADRPVTGVLAGLTALLAVAAVRWTVCATACAAGTVAGVAADQILPSPRLTSTPIVVLAVLLTGYLIIGDGRLTRPHRWFPALAACAAIVTTGAAAMLRLPAPTVPAGLAAVAAAAVIAVRPLHHPERQDERP